MEHRPALEQQSSRRHLTILFADLSSSTWLGDHLDPEEFEDLLAQVYDLYERVIGRHHGRMAQVQGDGVFAVFGHPQPAEQDCWHAVTAALEMRDAARALQTPYLRRLKHQLDMHSGIHSGLVLFSAGDDLLGRYRLVGDATNVAHRLSDVADAGEVLVSATTLGPHQHLFNLGESRQLELAGKRRSQLAWNIIGPAAVDNAFAARDSAGLTRFVGRQQEMDELNSRLLTASDGVPTVIAIVAPAGIGKTRLATELLNGATAGLWQHHRGYCESYLGAAPLQPFRQMAAQLLATTQAPTENPAGAQTVAIDQQLVRAIAEPSDERSVSHAFCQLLSQMAKTRPQLVFVDDFQWADQASVEIVDAISRLEGLPILVLLTTRDRSHLGAIAADIVELPLQELAAPALRAAAESLLQHPDPFTLADVCVRAGGNPLFLEEICHAYSRDPAASTDTPASTAWLDILIESRFAQLPDGDARIVPRHRFMVPILT